MYVSATIRVTLTCHHCGKEEKHEIPLSEFRVESLDLNEDSGIIERGITFSLPYYWHKRYLPHRGRCEHVCVCEGCVYSSALSVEPDYI
jgi:hypothetical protein